MIYAVNFHISLTTGKITGTIVITINDRPLRLFDSQKIFFLSAKEKLNIQKNVEFHALSFYPSKSEMWRGGRFTIKSGGVLSNRKVNIRFLIVCLNIG